MTYRSNPTCWTSNALFEEYYQEPFVIIVHQGNAPRRVHIDSCRAHKESRALMEALTEIYMELRRFTPNYTLVVQPIDEHNLREFKRTRRNLCDMEKYRLDQNNEFLNIVRLQNPGKSFMLEMVREVIDELNAREIEGISYSRLAMIQTGPCPDTDGIWNISRLNSNVTNNRSRKHALL